MSETTFRRPRLRPRDAATLVIIDRTSAEPRVLMGRRSAAQVFLPGKYVFPGGRVDASDRRITPATPLGPQEARMLLIAMRGRPSTRRAEAMALAAVRETFEETGIIIGRPATAGTAPPPWQPFFGCGFAPALGSLVYFARAITPPGRPRRYDTRFFAVEAGHIAHRLERVDGELEALSWVSLAEARSLDLAGITRMVIEDLAALLEEGMAAPAAPVPFYFHRNGRFERALLSQSVVMP